MKIENGGTFQPIVITVETQREADALAAIFGQVSGSSPGDIVYKLFCELDSGEKEYKAIGSLKLLDSGEDF